MKSFLYLFLLLFIFSLSIGCASIVSKSAYPVSINSSPSEAEVSITNRKGVEIEKAITPITLSLKANEGFFKSESYSFRFTKEGYSPSFESMQASIDGWYWGNLLFGGLIGFLIVDPATGSMWKLDDNIQADLQKDEASSIAGRLSGESTKSISIMIERPSAKELQAYTPMFTIAVAVADLTGILSDPELETLSERLRGNLAQTEYFKLVSKNDMSSIFEAQKFSRSTACGETSCLSEMGKILAVEKMIGGNIGKVGNRFSVSLRMVDVQTGTIDYQIDKGGEFRVEDLLDLIPIMGENLALKYGKSQKKEIQ